MDMCKSCGSAITENYFRVRSQMSCAACARIASEEANRDPTPFILKGILYAFVGACMGALLRCGFEALGLLVGGSLGLIGMFFRWFVFVAVGGLIVTCAKTGSSGRGGIALQLFSTAFFYLAVSLAFVPIIFYGNAKIPHDLSAVMAISLLALKLPFLSIARNPINITGLIAIVVCMGAVWSGTAAAPDPVDGPFEATAPGEEANFFKARAPLPPV